MPDLFYWGKLIYMIYQSINQSNIFALTVSYIHPPHTHTHPTYAREGLHDAARTYASMILQPLLFPFVQCDMKKNNKTFYHFRFT